MEYVKLFLFVYVLRILFTITDLLAKWATGSIRRKWFERKNRL